MGGTLLSRGNNTRHGQLRRRDRGPQADPRCDLGHARAPLPGAVRDGGRAGVPEVREPAADRVVQGTRGLLQDRQALRRRTGPRRRRGQRGQPRPGGRVRRRAARLRGHRGHAGGRAAAQGPGDAGLRGGGHPARQLRGGRRSARPWPSPSGPAPCSSIPTTTRTSWPGRARSASRSSSSARRCARSWCRWAGAASRPASRWRSRASTRRSRSSACRRRRSRRTRARWRPGTRCRCRPAPPWRTASRSAARVTSRSASCPATPGGW